MAQLWAADCHPLLTAQGRTSGAGCAARLSQSSGRSSVGVKRESCGAASAVALQVPSNQPSLPKRRKRARHRRCQGPCTRSANHLNLGTVRAGKAGRRCWRAVHRPRSLAAHRLFHSRSTPLTHFVLALVFHDIHVFSLHIIGGLLYPPFELYS